MIPFKHCKYGENKHNIYIYTVYKQAQPVSRDRNTIKSCLYLIVVIYLYHYDYRRQIVYNLHQ